MKTHGHGFAGEMHEWNRLDDTVCGIFHSADNQV